MSSNSAASFYKYIPLFLSLLFLSMPLFASTPPNKKKLLILIIASDNHPAFIELQEIWRRYMHSDPEHIEAYFIKGDPNLSVENEIVGDTIYSRIKDCYRPGILEKTVLSMEFMLDKIKECDYVLRTNLSSFYVFPKLLRFLNTLPKTNCYCGRPLVPCHGDVTSEFYNVPFAWGLGFILSPDMAELLVENKEELLAKKWDAPDDVAIGGFFHNKGVKITLADFVAFTTYNDWVRKKEVLPKNAFHFRAKKHYLKRQKQDNYDDELLILTELLEKFYPEAN